MTFRILTSCLLGLTLALGLTACGGGGNNNNTPPPPAATPPGSYYFVAGSADATAGDASTTWGDMELTAADVAFTTRINNGTTVSAPVAGSPAPYTIDASRVFSVAAGAFSLSGRWAANGKAVHMSFMNAGPSPFQGIAIRKGGTHSTASLAETYAGVLVGPGQALLWGHYTFDGAGNFTFSWNGTAGALVASGAHSGTYTVAADGALTMTFTSAAGQVTEGMVGVDGDLIVFAGGNANGDTPFYGAMIRRAPGGATAATFDGTYIGRSLGTDPTATDAVGRAESLIADGSGTFTLSGTENRDGAHSAFIDPGNTYSVAVDGAMTIMSAGASYWGYVMADGEIAIYAGQTTAPTQTRFSFLIR